MLTNFILCIYLHMNVTKIAMSEWLKMADEEQQEIENALNTIAILTEQSTKMKKELKQFTTQ